MSRVKVKNVQLELFALDTSYAQWDGIPVYQLQMPKEWKTFIQQFGTAKEFELTKKIKPLGMKLQSIFPEIIWVNNQFHLDIHSSWLISLQPIPTSFLIPLCYSWLSHLAEQEKKTLPPIILEEELVWEENRLSSILNDKNKFSVIPSWMAYRFSQQPKLFTDQTGKELELQFSQVFFGSYAECMSQPIERESGYYSYSVQFRLKNRGGHPNRLLLHVSLSVRRFITKPFNTQYVKGRINSSVLVSLAHPFMRQFGMSRKAYAQLSFCRKHNSSPYTGWTDGLDDLFWDVLFGRPFSSEELLEDPQRYWRNGDLEALVIHNNTIFGSHSIGPGASKGEHNGLYNLVRAEFADLVQVQPLSHVQDSLSRRRTRNDPKLPLLHSPSYNSNLVLEVWGPSELFHHVQKVLQKIAAEGTETDSIYLLNTDRNVHLHLIHQSDDSFSQSLDTDIHGFAAFDERAQEIANSLDATNRPILSIIEILEKEFWTKKPEQDPKDAIREGFRRSGRITQFINPIKPPKQTRFGKEVEGSAEQEYAYRVERALMDLLADSGMLNMAVWNKLSHTRTLYGFDVLKVTQLGMGYRREVSNWYPLMTKLHEGDIYAKGMGNDRWLPLREAILQCKSLTSVKYNKEAPQAVKQWLQQALMQEIMNGERPILFIDADLRNSWFKGVLTNPHVGVDRNPELASWVPGDSRLNIIRVNTTEDVPRYRFYPEEFNESFYKGVFYDEDGIYYSIGEKPLAMRKVSRLRNKYDDPRVTFSQPRAIELIPMGYSDTQDRHESVWIAHHLRELAVSFDLTTVLPYPLKIMKSIHKYLETGNVEKVKSGWDPELVEM